LLYTLHLHYLRYTKKNDKQKGFRKLQLVRTNS